MYTEIKTLIPEGWTKVTLCGEEVVMPATVYARLSRRVNRGVKWLDKKLPEWASHISLDSLDLASAHTCVCGQLFMNGFSEKVFKNHEDMVGYSGYDRVACIKDEKWLERHGFVDTGTSYWYHKDRQFSEHTFQNGAVYEWLTFMWADAIKERVE